VLFLSSGCGGDIEGLRLTPLETLGSLELDHAEAPIKGATWYVAEDAGDGVAYRFPAGALAKAECLTADMLLDGNHMIVFSLALQEGEGGRVFRFRFSGLNQCSFRVRMPLSLVDQNRWGIDREGAFLKPRCSGARVDLERVDRMTLAVSRKGPQPARWCMTPFVVAEEAVRTISEPVLPKGPLLDELGQSTIHDWPGKTRSIDEVVLRIRSQLQEASNHTWPESFTRWGGWKAKRIDKGSGFFRMHHDGRRWWLLDPDGHAFWSAGLDCVRVNTSACGCPIRKASIGRPTGSGRAIARIASS